MTAHVQQPFEQNQLLRACRRFRFLVPQHVHGNPEASTELLSEKRTSDRKEYYGNM